jgi:hypothetical protein
VGLGLVQDVGQVAEDVDEARNARLIHGNGHGEPLQEVVMFDVGEIPASRHESRTLGHSIPMLPRGY